MSIRVVLGRLVSTIKAADANTNTRERTKDRKTNVMETTTTTTTTSTAAGRRSLLLTSMAAAAQATDSKNELLQKYLKKTEENKSKNDKERMDSYYKRNYKDYFGFVEGSLKEKNEPLSESEKGILEWLKTNK